MGVKSLLERLRGESNDDRSGNPSHVCPDCGETYNLGPNVEVQSCRACGSDRVEPVDRPEPIEA